MTPTALLVVAKAPVPGLAKTRLTPDLSAEQAAGVAAASLLDTVEAVAATRGVQPVIAMTGDLDAAVRADELRAALDGWTVLPQRGTGFGERLAAAHADTAAAHPGSPVLQIGMDTPQVSPELLSHACGLLSTADSVLGMAEDGGWWAAGFRDPGFAALLGGIPTSRDDTGSRTLAAMRSAGLDPAELPSLSDVDTLVDLVAVAGLVPGSRFAASVPAGAGR
ncbi:hypothetical protein A8924_3734 [Saccharopolyspora erythraea NRRL 2338]|uniref:Uncharacterized protein n=2 Tax=Saccharopolyspora erythraea TaxID=1836 RepID=A4FEZ0_SACEN|nr:DUF2064 domain-containing protein [Saccharopolyspora erythraea]EQD82604.1 hypothetical protein N599_29815 [Saccharopolyspora erythraea D]PFG96341.1 hypothetical protein A8924_3734 [Saccharopolyspora erythraea NRRL 2338]QRK92855.1 DUF2064 domain-containing protein [Saccharopolyspora erythraea]CAM02615.1 hypothetical protein SACE_3340 [Saccharopolyspora erythraea NRRL 2338]